MYESAIGALNCVVERTSCRDGEMREAFSSLSAGGKWGAWRVERSVPR